MSVLQRTNPFPIALGNAGATYYPSGLYPGFSFAPTPSYQQGYTSIGPPFSADATPTSGWFSSGLFGSGMGLAGSMNYLPPPDITGYTYGDYATPNYNNPAAAGVPQPTPLYNATNPAAMPATPQSLTKKQYFIIGGALGAVILLGAMVDHSKKSKRKKRK